MTKRAAAKAAMEGSRNCCGGTCSSDHCPPTPDECYGLSPGEALSWIPRLLAVMESKTESLEGVAGSLQGFLSRTLGEVCEWEAKDESHLLLEGSLNRLEAALRGLGRVLTRVEDLAARLREIG